MNHPTPEACRKVAATLRKAHEMFPGEVSMTSTDVLVKGATIRGDAACRTVACHAGHYMIGLMGKNACGWDYSHGALKMANNMGFKSSADLTRWAAGNPNIWGGEFGSSMFFSYLSFGLPFGVAVTVPHIADWWERVGDRLEALEIAGSGE